MPPAYAITFDRAAGSWVAVMDQCLAGGRYDRCRAMITLLAALPSGQAGQAQLVYRIARADIGLGQWADAEALLDSLPAQSPHATLLQADIAFCRGDFAQAEDLASAALGQTGGPGRRGSCSGWPRSSCTGAASLTPASTPGKGWA